MEFQHFFPLVGMGYAYKSFVRSDKLRQLVYGKSVFLRISGTENISVYKIHIYCKGSRSVKYAGYLILRLTYYSVVFKQFAYIVEGYAENRIVLASAQSSVYPFKIKKLSVPVIAANGGPYGSVGSLSLKAGFLGFFYVIGMELFPDVVMLTRKIIGSIALQDCLLLRFFQPSQIQQWVTCFFPLIV